MKLGKAVTLGTLACSLVTTDLAAAPKFYSRSPASFFQKCQQILVSLKAQPFGEPRIARNERIGLSQIEDAASNHEALVVRDPYPFDVSRHYVIVSDPRVEEGKAVKYLQTNRGFAPGGIGESLSKIYPSELMDLKSLRGKIVLDAGTGRGRFVEDLRDLGVEAYGLDISLPAELRQTPYFFEASMENTRLPSNSVDVIYSSLSFFHYSPAAVDVSASILKEFSRILKSGGRIRIAPCKPAFIKEALRETPELQVLSERMKPFGAIEIKKRSRLLNLKAW